MSIWRSGQNETPGVSPPSGSTPVSVGETVSLAKGTTRTFIFTIPVNASFFLQGFWCGAYTDKVDSDKPVNARCLLRWQPAGSILGPPPESIIDIIYLHRQGAVPEISYSNIGEFAGVNFVGDGIKRFILQVDNKSPEVIEFTNRIRGYYQ